jgi:hypothetical protein
MIAKTATHVICIKPFEEIPLDAKLPMKVVTTHFHHEVKQHDRTTSVSRNETTIKLTTSEGHLHQFYTSPELAREAKQSGSRLIPNRYRTDEFLRQIYFHDVALFASHFAIPAQSSLLDLLNAIVEANTQE